MQGLGELEALVMDVVWNTSAAVRVRDVIDQLEEAGVLSPSEGGARPRDVLVGIQDLDRICGTD